MPKAERGSVKDIANRIKAKGLQKLKFYCQMCQKQCRDANGFKCHIQSESHLRQMKIFSDNAGGILEKYSRDFERFFLTTLKMRHGTKKVNANNVYQEVISDKEHIHMNATHWTTLTEFVQYLGKSGKCIVEENHTDGTGGWYISYIERDSGILARREAQQRREAADQKAEAALLQRMKEQRIAAAKALDKAGGSVKLEASSILDREHKGIAPVKLGLASTKRAKRPPSTQVAPSAFGDADDENDTEERTNTKLPTNVEAMIPEISERENPTKVNTKTSVAKDSHLMKRKHSDDRPEKDTSKRSKSEPSKMTKEDEGWLHRDILVRVISKKLAGGKYFRRKAAVDKVLDNGFAAEVEIFADGEPCDGDILRLDQSDLETVIPKAVASSGKPKKVRILRGDHKGKKAKVDKLDKGRYRADLLLYEKGRTNSERECLLKKVPYEDFSQIA